MSVPDADYQGLFGSRCLLAVLGACLTIILDTRPAWSSIRSMVSIGDALQLSKHRE